MSYADWRLIIGDKEERTWGGNEYLFRTGKDQLDADLVLKELQSNTPLRNFIELASEDNIIRVISFLSYYLINPTFRHEDTEDAGADLFWFPLDQLTDERLEELVGEVDDEEEEAEDDEEEDDDEDAALPDFPVMSTVSEPIIEAAISEDYVNKVGRESAGERYEILQDEIKRKQQEELEKIEAWLEENINKNIRSDFSVWAEELGTLPARIILGGMYYERSRLEDIHEIFTTMDPVERPSDLSPEILLNKLNSLTEDHPVLVNPAIEGYCRDQKDRDCQFHITKHRGYEIEGKLEECEHCGSDLYRIFRAGIDDTVRDAWMLGLIPELVTARVLDGCEWVDEVIPHRKVQMKKDGRLTPSVEVDVTVRTTNDEVLFFEVTSQREALDRVVRKKNKFIENGIEFDGIVQLSLTDNNDFVDFGDNVVAGGAWMIPDLEHPKFIGNLTEYVDIEDQ